MTLSRSDIAVVTINWNGWRHTLACLESLRASTGAAWHLYIVDNASSDDSLDHLRDLGGDVTLIRSPINGGWTGGNNLGLRHALDAGHETFFIFNNDATVQPDTLAQLLHAQRGYGADTPLLGPVQRSVDDAAYGFIGAHIDSSTGMPQQDRVDGVQPGDLPPVWQTPYIRGAGLFVTREHIERIGLFDDRFYLNYDETDWCFRARAAGIPAIMVRDAVILHVESAAIGGASSPLNLYFLTRNQLLFAERHCTRVQRLRIARNLMRRIRRYAGDRPSWPARLLLSRASAMIALRAGVRDYLLRRFGDCPAQIRTLRSGQ